MLHLTLVRHASTAWNEAGRYQGWGDPPLSPRGRAEALALGPALAAEAFDRVVASDLARTAETARIALPSAEIEADPRLREMHFGAWEGLTWNECVARDGRLVHRWVSDPAAHAPPDGETLAAFEARIAEALAELPSAGRILWVVHAGVIHSVLARWMGIEIGRTFALRLSPCGITRAEIHPDGVRILGVNEGGGQAVVPAPAAEA
ncbi:MAG: Phosphoglycerate mutase [Gemmatimonadetes bacterium]|nr:Phosphoglycerate mutase [Gemmatimonadota bacterium]